MLYVSHYILKYRFLVCWCFRKTVDDPHFAHKTLHSELFILLVIIYPHVEKNNKSNAYLIMIFLIYLITLGPGRLIQIACPNLWLIFYPIPKADVSKYNNQL